MKDKNELIEKEEQGYIQLIDQTGVENAIGKLVVKNNSLLPSNVAIERIKNSAGFYISNNKDLMSMDGKNKMTMLYGVLKEAMLGLEAGSDYDILPFKGKPVVIRNKNGWFKIIDMIKPAEIIRFTNNVAFMGDKFKFNPVTEELVHEQVVTSDKYEDIECAYAYIKFANGFEKTVVLSKKDLDSIKRVSPSAGTAFSPWTSMPVKMSKTKVVKELAKELFTLYGGRINAVLSQVIESDESTTKRVNNNGFIEDDKTIYNGEAVEKDITPVSLDEL